MEITEVKVFPIAEEKLKAFVSVVFDRCFMVNDIKIIQGRDGLFISMPSRKKKNGEFKDVAHPLNNQTRRRIEDEILEEYERVLAERGAPQPIVSKPPVPQPPVSQPAVSRPAASRPADARPERRNGDRPSEARTPQPVAAEASSPAPAVSDPPVSEPSADGLAAEPASRNGNPEVDEAGQERPSLEEVQEAHLSDSFWTVS